MAPQNKNTTKRNRKQMTKWNSEETINLIDAMEEHPHLWNKNFKEYKDKNKRKNSLKEISEFIEKTPEDIWIKWQNLRVTFNSVLRQMQQKTNEPGANENFNPKWEYFNRMLFLEKRKFPTKPSNSNVEIELVHEHDQEQDQKQDEDPLISITKPIKQNKMKKKRKIYKNKAIIKNAIKILSKPLDSSQIFGDFVAQRLKKLPKNRRNKLELMIQKAILSVQLESDDNDE